MILDNVKKVSALLFLVLSFLMYKIILFKWDFYYLCELSARPFIYGDDLCNDFESDILRFSLRDNFFSILIILVSQKPVFMSKLHGNPIILKRLATQKEFKELDEFVSLELNLKSLTTPFLEDKIIETITGDITEEKNPKLYLCPRPENKTKFFGQIFESEGAVREPQYLNILTIVRVNPEPVVLKILKPPEWPVPKFLGSCGRIAAFEYCGDTVTSYISAPWFFRANISYQLLVAADRFTFKHSQYSFYLTDISPDNVVVDTTNSIRFVDLENVIIVDKRTNSAQKESAGVHTSENTDCNNCFSFSTYDICKHSISDHNIFGICKAILHPNFILPHGLLHSPPKEIIHDYRTLESLILECVNTTVPNRRFSISKDIQKLLLKIFNP